VHIEQAHDLAPEDVFNTAMAANPDVAGSSLQFGETTSSPSTSSAGQKGEDIVMGSQNKERNQQSTVCQNSSSDEIHWDSLNDSRMGNSETNRSQLQAAISRINRLKSSIHQIPANTPVELNGAGESGETDRLLEAGTFTQPMQSSLEAGPSSHNAMEQPVREISNALADLLSVAGPNLLPANPTPVDSALTSTSNIQSAATESVIEPHVELLVDVDFSSLPPAQQMEILMTQAIKELDMPRSFRKFLNFDRPMDKRRSGQLAQ